MVKAKPRRPLQTAYFPLVSINNSFKALLLAPFAATTLYLTFFKETLAQLPLLQAAMTSRAEPLRPAFYPASWTPTIAQATPPLPLAQQGTQIVLNGRPLNAAWSQRQGRIGISDLGLVQTLGAELLDTEDPTRQPVQWFSDPARQPLLLATWLTAQYRYVDITDLAQSAGWQVQLNGATLQINTPSSSVVGIRQGRQSWGDRFVIDLDRATSWQVTEQSGEFIVAIDAQANPTLVQSFTALPGNRFTGFRIETSGNQTLIRVGVPAGIRPRVFTLPTPNRLVIDVRPDWAVPRSIVWSPGMRWVQQTVNISSGQFPIVALLVNPRQPGLSLRPIWANPTSSVGTAPVVTLAQRWQVAAAINGGFFNRNNTLPLGAVRQDGRWVSGPILGRGAIAWNQTGEVIFDRFRLQETIATTTGQRYPLTELNSGYVRAGLARYTPDWGGTYTPIADNETVITVQNNQVIQQQSSGAAGQTNFPIPTNGYLLVARAFNTAVAAFPVGTGVQVESNATPAAFNNYPQIVGGGPLLIQNGRIVLNAQAEQFSTAFIQERAVRSAIGKTPEGNLMVVAIQNRIGGAGPSLQETAQIMQQLGATDALNLDGGSSTSLYLGGQLLNRAPRTAARVHNAIGIFLQPTF